MNEIEIKRAVEVLKMENELMQFDSNTGEDYPIELQNQDNQDLYKANLIAIKVLEKQIPKMPLFEDNGGYPEYFEDWLECPICGEAIPEYTAEKNTWCYCLGCGQRLSWEEV